MNIGWLTHKFFLKIVVFKDIFNSKVIQKVIHNFKKVTPILTPKVTDYSLKYILKNVINYQENYQKSN
jgi:hypothetical protein